MTFGLELEGVKTRQNTLKASKSETLAHEWPSPSIFSLSRSHKAGSLTRVKVEMNRNQVGKVAATLEPQGLGTTHWLILIFSVTSFDISQLRITLC